MKFFTAMDRQRVRFVASRIALAGISGTLLLGGCGTPGAPQPPSLKLPERVTDLAASRFGNRVELHWTTPKKTTDHLLLKGPVKATVCRRENDRICEPAGEVAVAPGADGEFHELLPASLHSGQPRQLDYFVELKGPKGRSSGLSNAAVVLAGTAPAAIAGLTAEVRADGVALHWSGGESTAVRLHRRLLAPAARDKKQVRTPMTPAPEPELRDLLVDPPSSGQTVGALDKTVRFGEVYEYTAQRIVQVPGSATGTGQLMEIAGESSAPIRVDVVDSFPPAVPQELVAVFVTQDKTIDLSWQPVTDEDLAGYIVYRAESLSSWKRISGQPPIAGTAYRDTAVEAGHSYRYAVTAIDLTGHESERSPEARETIPESGSNP